jgi:putative heme iron utilization protein
MDLALELLMELSKNDNMMWVVGSGDVVSENNSEGIKEPEVSDRFMTIEADNWHFHVGLDSISSIQFVESQSHGDLLSYYVRFSNDTADKEETLVRSYFPNPYLDADSKRTELQPEKLRAFEEMRDKYVGREEGIVFVQRTRRDERTKGPPPVAL